MTEKTKDEVLAWLHSRLKVNADASSIAAYLRSAIELLDPPKPEPRVIPEVDGLLTCPDCGSHEFKENGSHPCDWGYSGQNPSGTYTLAAAYLRDQSVLVDPERPDQKWRVDEILRDGTDVIVATTNVVYGDHSVTRYGGDDQVTIEHPKALVLDGSFEWYEGDFGSYECCGCGAIFDDLADGWVSDYT